MDITDIRITPAEPGANERLQAYASLVIDNALCIRDLKIIRNERLGLFLAFPGRKLRDRCPVCQGKNLLEARWCNWCGQMLGTERILLDSSGREVIERNVAFPINPASRTQITDAVIGAFQRGQHERPRNA